MTKAYQAMAYIAEEPELDPEKAQAYLRKFLDRMEKLPEVGRMVTKALKNAEADGAWDAPDFGESFRMNGTH